MGMNATENSLHSMLFAEDRELENFKFFPGDDRGLTADRLCDAARRAVRTAFDGGLVDTPPSTMAQKRML